jgi:hypothetical protein
MVGRAGDAGHTYSESDGVGLVTASGMGGAQQNIPAAQWAPARARRKPRRKEPRAARPRGSRLNPGDQGGREIAHRNPALPMTRRAQPCAGHPCNLAQVPAQPCAPGPLLIFSFFSTLPNREGWRAPRGWPRAHFRGATPPTDWLTAGGKFWLRTTTRSGRPWCRVVSERTESRPIGQRRLTRRARSPRR